MWRGRKHRRSEIFGVCSLHHANSAVTPEALSKLVVSDVYSVNEARAALQHAVREPAGGRTDVDGYSIDKVEREVLDGSRKLFSAPSNILQPHPSEANSSVDWHLRAGFIDWLVVDQHVAGENQCLRLFPGRRKTSLDELHVKPLTGGLCGAHWLRTLGLAHRGAALALGCRRNGWGLTLKYVPRLEQLQRFFKLRIVLEHLIKVSR